MFCFPGFVGPVPLKRWSRHRQHPLRGSGVGIAREGGWEWPSAWDTDFGSRKRWDRGCQKEATGTETKWKWQQTWEQKTLQVTVWLGNQAFPQDWQEETSILTASCWRSCSAGQPAGCRTPWDREVTFFRVTGLVPTVSLLIHRILQPLRQAECAMSQPPTAHQWKIFQRSATTEKDA